MPDKKETKFTYRPEVIDGVTLMINPHSGFAVRPAREDYKTKEEFQKAFVVFKKYVRDLREELRMKAGLAGPMREKGTLGRPTKSPADSFQVEHGPGARLDNEATCITVQFSERERARMYAGRESFASSNPNHMRHEAYVTVDTSGLWAKDREEWNDQLNKARGGADSFMSRYLKPRF